MYVNSLLATLNARGSLLGGARRRRRSRDPKASFRTPSTMDPHATSHAQGIEVRPRSPRPLPALG